MKAAVVGVGYLGRFHAEKYAENNEAELSAIVDVNAELAAQYAEKYGAQALTDYKLLPELGVRCASVVTTTTTHYEVARYLLEHGVDVLLEKPMTETTAQARELIQIAKANKRILQVGHLERYNPAFRAVRDSLTKPLFFEVRRISPFSGRGSDVDVVLDLMIHDIDIVSHLVGRPLKRLEAVGVPVLTDSFDIANARLTFEGGAVANVTASRAAFKSERTIRIFQPDVYVSLDYGQKKLKVYTRKEVPGQKLPQISIHEHQVEERDALRDEIHAFLCCVEERKTPEVTGEDGLRALELAGLIRQAMNDSLAEYNAAVKFEAPQQQLQS